jgi:ubiquinone/menaquinone biosynthesis C-methylase UbiE
MTTAKGPAKSGGSRDAPVPSEAPRVTDGIAPPGTRFWDKRAKRYDTAVQQHGALYEKTIRKTTSLLEETDIVLDFACATGEITLDVAPRVRQIHGIDTSERMIDLATKKARTRQIDNASFSRTDVFDQRLTRHSFSAIMAFSIFHLLDDAPGVLDRLHDLLVPGGLLISETPCLAERHWIIRSLIKLAVAVGFAPQIRDLTITDLESLVSSSNFQILETKIWDEKSAVHWVVARKV